MSASRSLPRFALSPDYITLLAGNYDWICNWIGNLAWTNALEWTHGSSFASKNLVEWKVDGERAGQTKSAGGLTYATVEKAGHMVSRCAWVINWLADNARTRRSHTTDRYRHLQC